ncbi:MAG: glycosyltransferase [Planctomycetaceae bacterium]
MKILFIQKRILFPTDAGMKIRTLNVVRSLARWHDVTYLCNVDDADGPYLDRMRSLGVRLETVPWCETPRGGARFYGELLWNLLSPYPYNVAKDYDPRLRRRAAELLAGDSYDLVVCDFVQMARNVNGLAMPASVLFQHNVEAEIFRRMALVGSLPRRVYLGHQHRKMQRFEADAGRRFDRVVAVSDRDRSAFEREYGWSHVRTIDTAVATDHFHPIAAPEVPGRLVFVGSLDWLPNEEGLRWFVERVWPRIRSERPDATFQIVGRNPPASLARAAETSGVELIGTVPDVRPYLADSQVVVVPLLTGGGTRLKIYEAMAMKKANVSTTLGAEGLPLTPDEHLLIADDAETFAAAVLGLLNDARKREAVSEAAFDLVTRSYTAEAVARQFEAICLEAAGSTARDETVRTCTP